MDSLKSYHIFKDNFRTETNREENSKKDQDNHWTRKKEKDQRRKLYGDFNSQIIQIRYKLQVRTCIYIILFIFQFTIYKQREIIFRFMTNIE